VRDAIERDRRLTAYDFYVVVKQKKGRAPGWTKLRSHAEGRRGAINIVWDPATRILTCRVVNRGSGKPSLIIGDFVDYLLQRHRRRIKLITILPT
jgi:hypothetical protein